MEIAGKLPPWGRGLHASEEEGGPRCSLDWLGNVTPIPLGSYGYYKRWGLKIGKRERCLSAPKKIQGRIV